MLLLLLLLQGWKMLFALRSSILLLLLPQITVLLHQVHQERRLR